MGNSTDKNEVHVMIDLETLGLKPGCKILSIGAYVFAGAADDLTEDLKQYYIRLEHTSQNLTVDPATIAWWNRQDPEVYAEAFGGTAIIQYALADFSEWLKGLKVYGVVHVWGNSASFDLSILKAAHDAYFAPIPWNYKNEECYRTLKNRMKNIITENPFEGTKHNALHDAIHQGKHCADMLYWIEHSLCTSGRFM